jgi:hypothetical protein
MGGKRKSSYGSESEYFWSKVQKSDGCWRWAGAIGGTGYGSVNFNGKWCKAHRLAWELTNGPIPKGEGTHGTVVAHKCDNRWCVNPEHLFLCSQQENVADMLAKGRGSRGYEQGGNLREEDVLRIREAALFGARYEDLADIYGVSRSLVALIARGERWAHIGGIRTKRPPNKLSETDVASIREKLAAGRAIRALAREYGVAQGTIQHIARGHTWRSAGAT